MEPYEGAPGATRQVLIAASADGPSVALRYFELPAGARSGEDRHAHEHVVYVVRGRGVALLGGKPIDLRPHDAVHIGPYEPHRFEASSEGPFGFLCVRPRA